MGSGSSFAWSCSRDRPRSMSAPRNMSPAMPENGSMCRCLLMVCLISNCPWLFQGHLVFEISLGLLEWLLRRLSSLQGCLLL